MPGKRKSKTKRKFWTIFFIVVVVLLLLTVAQYVWNLKQNAEAHFVHNNDFGIDIPENFSIHGIDVSSYQGKIDWTKVKAMQSQNISIGFVFIKATEGLKSIDTCFKKNWSNVDTAGIPHGAYHFFIAGKDGALQAKNFIDNVQLRAGDLLPVVDVEALYNTSPETLRSELHDYVTTIENYYHVRPIIYSYATFYNDYLSDDFDDYPLWVAHYFEERKPRVHRHWDFWQHNEHGHVYGIDKDVDFSVFNSDSTEFAKLLMK